MEEELFPRRNRLPRKRMFAWLILCLGIGMLVEGLPAPSARADELPDVFQRITPEELRTLQERQGKTVRIVDTQSEDGYQEAHIRKARRLPWAPEITGPVKLSRRKTLVLYCQCDNEELAVDVARQLVGNFGYDPSKVLILQGGLTRWRELGYPVSQGRRR